MPANKITQIAMGDDQADKNQERKTGTNGFSQVSSLPELGTTSVNKEEGTGTSPAFPRVPVPPAPVAFSSWYPSVCI